MRKILLCAASVVAVLSSCSKNEVDYNLETADNAISFGVYTGLGETKSADGNNPVTDIDVIQAADSGFYVLGYYTQTAVADWSNETTATPNFMYNQNVLYNSTTPSWYYSPVKYWSEDMSDYYSFFAYAPEVDNSIGTNIGTLSTNASIGLPYIDFSFTDLSEMVDFVADVQLNKQSGKLHSTVTNDGATENTDGEIDKVEFSLLHETTRVSFTAITNITSTSTINEDKTYVIVKELSISDNGSGGSIFATRAKYTFASENDGTTTTKRGAWSGHTYSTSSLPLSGLLDKNNKEFGTDGSSAYTENKGVDVENGQSTATNLFDATSENSYLFLIPPAGSTGSSATATLTVKYDILTEDDALAKKYALSEDNIKTVTIPSGLFKQGQAYNLQLTFYLNEVVLEATVAEWTTEGGTITATADTEE